MPSLRDPQSRLALLRTLVGVPLAFFDALAQLVRFRADVCCTTGGVVAIPVTLAARLMRVPVYLWDGNALPGRATRLLASFSSRIGVSYEQARHALPRGRTVLAGTPIRASLLKWTRERGRETFAVPADAMLVVVSGGSQGSERVNDALWSALGRIIKSSYVLHITGEKQGARAESRRANLAAEVRDRYIVRTVPRRRDGRRAGGRGSRDRPGRRLLDRRAARLRRAAARHPVRRGDGGAPGGERARDGRDGRRADACARASSTAIV